MVKSITSRKNTLRLVVLFLVIMVTGACNKSDLMESWKNDGTVFYYYNDEKLYLDVDYSRISVSLKGSGARAALEATLIGDESIKSFSIFNPKAGLEVISIPEDDYYYAEVELINNQSVKKMENSLNRIRKSSSVLMATPALFGPNGEEMGVSNRFYVKLKKASDEKRIKFLANKYNVVIQGNNQYMPLWYVLSCHSRSAYNAIDAANKFYETGQFEAAEPEFLAKMIFTEYNSPQN